MNFNKIRSTCSKVRIVVGLALIVAAFVLDNNWFYLGIIPILAGLVKFCPLCIITKKCDLPS